MYYYYYYYHYLGSGNYRGITCEEAPRALCPWRGKHAFFNTYIIAYVLLIYKFIYATVKYVDL